MNETIAVAGDVARIFMAAILISGGLSLTVAYLVRRRRNKRRMAMIRRAYRAYARLQEIEKQQLDNLRLRRELEARGELGDEKPYSFEEELAVRLTGIKNALDGLNGIAQLNIVRLVASEGELMSILDDLLPDEGDALDRQDQKAEEVIYDECIR